MIAHIQPNQRAKSLLTLFIVILLMAALSACASDTEMPHNNTDGTDKMRGSPCVCEQLEFDGRGFKWIG